MDKPVKLTKPQAELLAEIVAKGPQNVSETYQPALKLLSLKLVERHSTAFAGRMWIRATIAGRAADAGRAHPAAATA